MAFALDLETVAGWAEEHRLVDRGEAVVAEELPGGVSASVIAVRVPRTGAAFVVKQALPQLRVADEWLATPERTNTETAAIRLYAELTPGAVPRVLAADPVEHVVALELIEGCVNWQAEVGEGRVHVEHAAWAGTTLGTWHAQTRGREDVRKRFGDIEQFEQQRLRPFHETVSLRVPELAPAIAPRLHELRHERTCIAHGDYALKNMLVGETGPWALDFETTHWGNPLCDLGFFLSFVVLSAIRWPHLEPELRSLEARFTTAYRAAVGTHAPHADDVAAHTACFILARTDGKSPALFFDERSRERARVVGRELLLEPEGGLWR